jgi:hypothetical protein
MVISHLTRRSMLWHASALRTTLDFVPDSSVFCDAANVSQPQLASLLAWLRVYMAKAAPGCAHMHSV